MSKLKLGLILFVFLAVFSLSACGAQTTVAPTTEATEVVEATTTATESEVAVADSADTTLDDSYADVLTFNNSTWNYDADNDVYWQIGVQYTATPETLDYETLGIYVPGAYVSATANSDGTYTLTLNVEGTLNGYTAETAPIVFPVNTPGYSAMPAPTAYNYSEVSSYVEAGFIYVYAGMRGRDNGYDASGNLTYSGGAPWGVTDLKAAVRYIRYNQEVLPGDTESIFVFGMSGGGAQSTIMGTTGDSALYTPYLESIGAAMYDANGQAISDAVAGVMAWCPITSLDYADEAYEWNMGQYSTSGTRADDTWTSALSDDLTAAYAVYINGLGLIDENGNALTLEVTEDGIYTAGSYYDYLVSVVEESLNNFLVDTTFPYTETSGGMRGMMGGMPSGGMPGGTPPSGGMPGGNSSSTETTSTTYETVQDYIDSLNADSEWVAYDATTNTVTITDLAGFVTTQKSASKSVAAFDDLSRAQAENDVFGNDENDSLHFDATLAALLTANLQEYAQYSDWDASYVEAYTTDLQALDKLGSSIQTRVDMYNPMYYLLNYYEGYQTSNVAKYWRIHTGIEQGDTANTVEMNLALALENYEGVNDVEFTTVWNQGHTTAERTGDSTTNFIAWVNDCVQQ